MVKKAMEKILSGTSGYCPNSTGSTGQSVEGSVQVEVKWNMFQGIQSGPGHWTRNRGRDYT